jgi:ferredoxin
VELGSEEALPFVGPRGACYGPDPMADRKDRVSENPTGKYYVDSQCIDCDVCRVTAPENFQRNEDRGYSYVSRQPESPDEEARCQEAMDSCPVEAIGSDGE